MAKDLFSNQIADYSRYRPSYPAELFDYILQFVIERDAAWDCGTGNGQAAVVLASYFKSVSATDISAKQLSVAHRLPNIEYLVAAAEETNFPANSFNLVTVAQAYHWFNFESFAKEVRRVSKSGAVIAAWGYNCIETGNHELNAAIDHFYSNTIGSYWDDERRFVEQSYETVPFDFKLLPSKSFAIKSRWIKSDLIGYLNSWSAVQHFITDRKYNPVDRFADEIKRIINEAAIIEITFPVFLKLGRVLHV